MIKNINLPNKAILCGASALAYLNIISFNPSLKTIALPRGSENRNYYRNKGFEVRGIELDIFEYKINKKMNIRIYSYERLFVDLCKTPLEATIKSEAIKNIQKFLNPYEVEKIYLKLKKRYRNVDWLFVEEYLAKNMTPINKYILKSPHLIGDYIREYVINIIDQFNLPVILKGGSAIELLIENKRATEDIDLIASSKNIEKLLKKLEDPKNDLYFKCDKDEWKKNKKSQIIRLNLSIISKNKEVQKIINLNVNNPEKLKIAFNTTFANEEVQSIIKTYQLTKKPLKYLKNKSCYIFSIEMIIAEKFQAIIGKVENTTRTKDLIDIFVLGKLNYQINKVYKWFLRKNQVNRDSKNEIEALKIIKKNIKMIPEKIKDNWDDANKMYQLSGSFDDAFKIYQKIGYQILEFSNKNKKNK